MIQEGPSVTLLRAHLAGVLEHRPGARLIGVSLAARPDWPETVRVGDRIFGISWCDCELALRQAIVDLDGGTDTDRPGLVLVTPLPPDTLGTDVMARLTRRRLDQIDPWQVLREAFHATKTVDPRLAGKRWLADALIASAPPGGYRPVSGGVLDAETAWHCLFEHGLGLGAARPDARDLLRWSLREDGPRRFLALPDEARTGISDQLSETAGAAGALIIGAVDGGAAAEVLPIGLALDILFPDEELPTGDHARAWGRLEPMVGNQKIELPAARAWAAAAVVVARDSMEADPQSGRRWLDRLDSLLQQLGMLDHAGVSDVSPRGFDQRLAAVAAAITTILDGEDEPEALAAIIDRCDTHLLARQNPDRILRLRMAWRLLGWRAARPTVPSADFSALAASYVSNGAFADRCRHHLAHGDEIVALADAYARLVDMAGDLREAENEAFAKALAAWNAAPDGPGTIPIEQVLSRFIAPLAEKTPIMMLVIDGLSLPIFRELFETLSGWVELQEDGAAAPAVAVAALPTITQVSRMSLLSGRLAIGTATREAKAFAQHPELCALSQSGRPPVLFHKDALGAGPLAPAVRDAIGDEKQRVVGVVYNAVDDQLSGASQLDVRWRIEDLRQLGPLLRAARDAGRILVVTADHGHVLDNGGTRQRRGGDGDRWRQDPGTPDASGEMMFSGPRVLDQGGSGSVVLAWSDRLRYGGRKAGYHGGASPQEVLVPLAVFGPIDLAPAGWREAPPPEPAWWSGPAMPGLRHADPPALASAPALAAAVSKAAAGQMDMFQPRPVSEAPASSDAWLETLLGSGIWALQVKVAGRVAPSDQQCRTILTALKAQGWRSNYRALAQAAGMPVLRIRGLLNGLRRVLNLDGIGVLELDDAKEVAMLKPDLLASQFDVAMD